jgi:hypothetical protein
MMVGDTLPSDWDIVEGLPSAGDWTTGVVGFSVIKALFSGLTVMVDV